MSNQKIIYPVTILKDRYQGTYSGGKWLAFELERSEIPDDIGGDDMEEMFFFKHTTLTFGRGNTPDEAFEDLKILLATPQKGMEE